MFKQIRTLFITFVIFQLIMSLLYSSFSFAAGTPPTLTIEAPVVSGSNVTVNGNVQSEAQQNVKIDITVGNENAGYETFESIPFDGVTGNFSYPIPKVFSDNNYSITVKATDIDTPTLYTEKTSSFTVDTTGPSIGFVTPSPVYQNKKNITISGTVSDAVTPANLITMELLDEFDIPVKDAVFMAPTVESNNWSFTLPGEYIDGTYNFKISASDNNQTPHQTLENYSVTVGIRPTVESLTVTSENEVFNQTTQEYERFVVDNNLLLNEDMTQVTTDTSIKVIISDETKINKVNASFNESDINTYPIEVLKSDGSNVPGTITVNDLVGSGDKKIEIEFTPASLEYSSTYDVLINPSYIDKEEGVTPTYKITDAAGNPSYTVISKFTTMSNIAKDPVTAAMYPHGNYTNNTNACATCHSSHNGVNDKLEKPSDDLEYTTSYYCMACHDGTVAAPLNSPLAQAPAPEDMNENTKDNSHLNDLTTKHSSAMDCAACHNPHNSWSEDNPNLLDNHYVVTDHPLAEGIPADGIVDSDEKSCITCHEEDSGRVMKFIPEVEGDPVVQNKVLHYRKLTATGVEDDYTLCFRCHDGSKAGIADIKSYYQQSDSKHRITGADGNLIRKTLTMNSTDDGHIPCVECHDSHGSSNVKLLKGNNVKIGHENRQIPFIATDPNTVLTGGGILIPTKEREFCLKCHNGLTAIYGVTGKSLTERTGHEIDNESSCSSCHGTGDTPEEKALSASHAPKRSTP